MQTDEAKARIAALGFSEADTGTLFAHFDDAERRGKLGHGYSRIEWLETLDDLRPDAVPVRLHAEPGCPMDEAGRPQSDRLHRRLSPGKPLRPHESRWKVL